MSLKTDDIVTYKDVIDKFIIELKQFCKNNCCNISDSTVYGKQDIRLIPDTLLCNVEIKTLVKLKKVDKTGNAKAKSTNIQIKTDSSSEYDFLKQTFDINYIEKDVNDFLKLKLSNNNEKYNSLMKRVVKTDEFLKVYNVLLTYIRTKIVRVCGFGTEIELTGTKNKDYSSFDDFIERAETEYKNTVRYFFRDVLNSDINVDNITISSNSFVSPEYFIKNINDYSQMIVLRQVLSFAR